MNNSWAYNIAKKIIIQNTNTVNDTVTVTLYTSNSDVISKIYNEQIELKSNEVLNLNTKAIEHLPEDNHLSISLPFIPFEIAPSELMQDTPETDIKAHEFQTYLIEFIKQNKEAIKNNQFTTNDIDRLNEALLVINIPEEEYKCAFLCKSVLTLAVKKYEADIKSIIEKYIPQPDYSISIIDLFREAYLKVVQDQIKLKQSALLQEKQETIKNAQTNNLNLFLPDVENHYEELNNRLVSFNYKKTLDLYQTIPEILYYWWPWLEKPSFIESKKTCSLNELKILICINKLNLIEHLYLGSEILNQKLKELFVERANVKKANLLIEIDNYIKNDPDTKELHELKKSIQELDIVKEFEDKDTTYRILLHWPELLFPEPIEIKECKDLLFDNLEIIQNV